MFYSITRVPGSIVVSRTDCPGRDCVSLVVVARKPTIAAVEFLIRRPDQTVTTTASVGRRMHSTATFIVVAGEDTISKVSERRQATSARTVNRRATVTMTLDSLSVN